MKTQTSQTFTAAFRLWTISSFLICAWSGQAATLMVTNNNDSGAGSLRQAIADASGGDSITFAPTVVGIISLTSSELSFTNSLTIIGPGSGILALSGSNTFRVFEILGGSNLISGLSIRDGLAAGSPGTTEQTGFDGRGGGIFNQGVALTLTDCVFSNNVATGGQGGSTGSNTGGNGGAGMGGAIYNIGPLKVTGCLMISNSATGGLGGNAGIGFAGGGGNAQGGAICSIATTLSLTRCMLTGNSSTGGAGGTATGSINVKGGQGSGGGLYTQGTANVTNSTLSFNQAVGGRGRGPNGNGSGVGGAIENAQILNLFTSTLATNQATGSLFDFGGALNEDGTAPSKLRSCTITGNSASYGGGIFGNTTSEDMGNTILAGNSATAAGGGADCNCTINSSDYNVIQNPSGVSISGGVTHNLSVDPMLGPLQDNGGPTFTMALLPGSPAIDQGKSFGITTDQRGRARPYNFAAISNAAGGDGADIGAFEAYPAPPSLSIALSAPDVLLSWPTNNTGYNLESKTNLNPALTWSTAGSPGIVGTNFVVTNPATGGSMFYRLSGQ